MSKPFIYIAAIRRTGSSVLSRALTQAPYSFVFQEPKLARGKFKVSKRAEKLFRENGLDISLTKDAFKKYSKGLKFFREHRTVKYFREKTLPELLKVFRQVGIKEIRNRGWEAVHKNFPGMKVLVTARDPRDIYISLYNKIHKDGKNVRVDGGFSPENVANDLMGEFMLQKGILETCDCMKVRYEDFCTDPGMFDAIKRFCESEIPGIGEIDMMNPHHMKIHEGKITDKRIKRWMQEENNDLVLDAQKAFDLMPEYTGFWGYDKKDGVLN